MEEEANQTSFKKIIKILIIAIVIVFLLILIIGLYFYFTKISPIFVSKPEIEKPILQNLSQATNPSTNNSSNQTIQLIKQEHIIFLLNEIEVYKLHNSGADIPKIKFIIMDLNKEYFFSVENNKIIEIENSLNPDIILKANQNILVEIFNAQNTKDSVISSYNNGKIGIEILADTTTLALKGYKALYDYFGITGNIISNFLS